MRRVVIPVDIAPGPAPELEKARVHTFRGETMGTSWSVHFAPTFEIDFPALYVGIQRELDLVVRQMSTWEPDSDISRFNRAQSGDWLGLPREFFTVLEYALRVASDSGGAYDPTVGPLVNLWGFGPEGKRTVPPPPEAIALARARTGGGRIQLRRATREALQPGGIYVDLSAVAKGFGVDQIASYLRRQGIAHFLAEVGGELVGSGMKPDGQPWWVALERPPGAHAGPPETVIALHGLAVATSGDYRRYFDDQGTRYSHTIDPRTSYPVAHRLASVTVLHRLCMHADALSTALYVLGPRDGMDFATRHNIAAHFVERTDKGLEETMSPAFHRLLD